MLHYCMVLPVFAMFFLDNCPKSSCFAEKIEEWHRRIISAGHYIILYKTTLLSTKNCQAFFEMIEI